MLVPAQGHSDGDVHYACVWRSCVCEWCTVHVPPPLKFCNEHRTTWPELSVSAEIEATPDHICGHNRATSCVQDSGIDVQGAVVINNRISA